jgi:hypothetical protein
MAEPADELAVRAIAEELRGLTGTRPWGGAYPNAPTVALDYRDPTQINQFPHFIVLEVDGSGFTLQTMSGGGGNFEHALELELGCYVQGDDVVAASTWKRRTRDDVRKALLKNRTLGGLVSHLEFTTYRTDEGEFGPIGVWWHGVRVLIDESMEVS